MINNTAENNIYILFSDPIPIIPSKGSAEVASGIEISCSTNFPFPRAMSTGIVKYLSSSTKKVIDSMSYNKRANKESPFIFQFLPAM